MKKIYSLGSLSFLLKRQCENLSIADIREAANTLTIDIKKVETYLEGAGLDVVVAVDLISFFQKRIEARA